MATKKKTNKLLGLEEAAAHLGMAPGDLMQSRGRGLAPGNLGFKEKGVLVWRESDLGPAQEVTPDSDE